MKREVEITVVEELPDDYMRKFSIAVASEDGRKLEFLTEHQVDYYMRMCVVGFAIGLSPEVAGQRAAKTLKEFIGNKNPTNN